MVMRFDFSDPPCARGHAYEGTYVRYADFTTLEAENAELKAEVEQLRDGQADELADIEAELIQTQAKCDKLQVVVDAAVDFIHAHDSDAGNIFDELDSRVHEYLEDNASDGG